MISASHGGNKGYFQRRGRKGGEKSVWRGHDPTIDLIIDPIIDFIGLRYCNKARGKVDIQPEAWGDPDFVWVRIPTWNSSSTMKMFQPCVSHNEWFRPSFIGLVPKKVLVTFGFPALIRIRFEFFCTVVLCWLSHRGPKCTSMPAGLADLVLDSVYNLCWLWRWFWAVVSVTHSCHRSMVLWEGFIIADLDTWGIENQRCQEPP